MGARARALGTLAGAAMLLAPPRVVKADDQDLTNEERRTVELFKQCSGSVVHINTFVAWICLKLFAFLFAMIKTYQTFMVKDATVFDVVKLDVSFIHKFQPNSSL